MTAKTLISKFATLSACSLVLLGASLEARAQSAKASTQTVIGFSIDDLRVERWGRDRDNFISAAEKLGAKVFVQSADANEARQISQIENLISRGVNVLVIVPFNSKSLGNVIAEARKGGIKVISYDRLILDSDVDAYITFDNKKVGEIQAQGVVNVVPKGNYYLLGGSPTDNNAKLLREGQMKVLQPLVDKGDIKIVGQQWVQDWDPSKAMRIVEDALTSNKNNIQGIVASNDGTAGGAVQALTGQGLAGKVGVSGQDSELAAVKRVIAGTQSMTVYKPITSIATRAAQMAVQLSKGEAPAYTTKLNNGKKDVDTVLIEPILLNKGNVDLLVKDGVFTKQQLDLK